MLRDNRWMSNLIFQKPKRFLNFIRLYLVLRWTRWDCIFWFWVEPHWTVNMRFPKRTVIFGQIWLVQIKCYKNKCSGSFKKTGLLSYHVTFPIQNFDFPFLGINSEINQMGCEWGVCICFKIKSSASPRLDESQCYKVLN